MESLGAAAGVSAGSADEPAAAAEIANAVAAVAIAIYRFEKTRGREWRVCDEWFIDLESIVNG